MTIRVNVIMGGPSVEHEVSLRSGLEVMANIDKNVYAVRAVVVSRNKDFFYCDPGETSLTSKNLNNPASSGRFKGPFAPASSAAIWEKCNVVFLAPGIRISIGNTVALSFFCAFSQERFPWIRERQISSSGYQIPLRLLRSSGQRGARQVS